jgi:hypothetical protein
MAACTHTRWLHVCRRGNGLVVRGSDRVHALLNRYADTYPSLFVFIGNFSKSSALQRIVSKKKRAKHPNEIHIEISSLANDRPVLIAEGDLGDSVALRPAYRAQNCHNTTEWEVSTRSTTDISNSIYCRILQPFADLYCLFASDLGGITSIVDHVVKWLEITEPPSSLPPQTYPQLCIIVESLCPTSKLEEEIQANFLSMLEQRSTRRISSLFSGVRVICLSPPNIGSSNVRYRQFIRQLMSISSTVRQGRLDSFNLLSAVHFSAFFGQVCQNFFTLPLQPFDFVAASRISSIYQDLEHHLARFMFSIPSLELVFQFAIPVFASCFLLHSYPTDAPSKLILLKLASWV